MDIYIYNGDILCLSCTAIGTDNEVLFNKKSTTHQAGTTLVAVEALRVPVLIFEGDKFAATKSYNGKEKK